MSGFIPGLELSRLYYEEAVRPILARHLPALVYDAGLIGPGSEVLGFDTEMSTDHSWAPRVTLYLSKADLTALAGKIHALMAAELPLRFRGYPTQLVPHPDDPGSSLMVAATGHPIEHHQVLTANLDAYVRGYAGIDLAQGVRLHDWLLVSEQILRSLTAGAVFHEGLGVLGAMQRQLAYYPDDVWLYLLGSQWQRIGQEEPLTGRAGSVGDETGAAVIAARLVRDLMRLCFLMERRYAPYPKWFGSAFRQLACAEEAGPLLAKILQAPGWQERQQLFGTVYSLLATRHNELGITASIATNVSAFYSRPFDVIWGEAIAARIYDRIESEQERALPRGVGKVDQFVDNVDVLSYPERARRLAPVYGEMG